MHAAVPPHHDDHGGGSVRDHADRARLWRERRCAPAARSGGGGRIGGLAIAHLVHHAGDLSVYGNFSALAARQYGAAGSAGSCRSILTFMKLATVTLLLVTCLPQVLSAQAPAQDPFLGWMDRIAQQQLDQRESAIAGILNVADANRRKQLVRERLTEILGGLPNYKGPLNPRTTDQIRNEFYTIEKVIFESLPGFFITANLYRPNQAGRYPAVLLQAGHTQEGKPEAQMVAANLAMKGFVALTYDPVGQGEREQTFTRQLGRPLAGGSVHEPVQAWGPTTP